LAIAVNSHKHKDILTKMKIVSVGARSVTKAVEVKTRKRRADFWTNGSHSLASSGNKANVRRGTNAHTYTHEEWKQTGFCTARELFEQQHYKASFTMEKEGQTIPNEHVQYVSKRQYGGLQKRTPLTRPGDALFFITQL